MPYRVKCTCPKLLHNAVIINIRLLTFVSSIRERAPRNIIVSWYEIFYAKIAANKIADADELKTRLIDEWAQFDQSIVDAAISQWRRRLSIRFRILWVHWA